MLTLVYTIRGETADSYIERVVAHLPKYRQVRVATSDGLEQSQILSTGAARMTSRELLMELKAAKHSGLSAHAVQQNASIKKNAISERLPKDIMSKL